MPKILVIVESPGKIKQMQEILGNDYIIKATCGHIYDLPEKGMNVDIKNNFKPTYEIKSDKKNIVNELRNAVTKCSSVILATDKDPEGEFIAWSLKVLLKLDDPIRISFNSITKNELLNAIQKGGKIDYDKVHSQQARRVVDRLEGYELSDVVNKCVQWKSTAGRVQSIVTMIIVDREIEIKKFNESSGNASYYKCTGLWNLSDDESSDSDEEENSNEIESILYCDESDSDEEEKVDDSFAKFKVDKKNPPEKVIKFLKKCQDAKFKINSLKKTTEINSPSAPFNTLSLQKEAFTKFGFSPKTTMSYAQILYQKGLITYMRTDSISMSKEAMDKIKKYVIQTYGEKYYKFKIWKTKDSSAQEAHEAIRPTYITNVPDEMTLEAHLLKLYSLIWKKTIASQMSPAEFDVMKIKISSSKINPYYFLATHKTLTFPGYLKVYGRKAEKNELKIKEGQEIFMKKITMTQEWNKGPSRYTQSSLLSQLKKLGIGRPATYAKMIQIVQDRKYVKIDDIKGTEINGFVLSITPNNKKIKEEKKKIMYGQDKKKFIPTELGIKVNDFLTKNFKDVINYKFTANMETDLEKIRDGKKEWTNVVKSHYDLFSPQVCEILKDVKKYSTKEDDKNSRLLGTKDGAQIMATVGQYGPVVKKVVPDKKSVFAPIVEPLTLEDITLEDALKLFEYPKKLGKYEKKDVKLCKGKKGLFIKHDGENYSCDKELKLEDAIKFIKEQKKKKRIFKTDKMTYSVIEGKYGPCILVKKNKNKKGEFVSIPKNEDLNKLTLETVKKIVENKPKKKKWNKSWSNKTTKFKKTKQVKSKSAK